MTKKDYELIARCVNMAIWVANTPSECKDMTKIDLVEYLAVLLSSQLVNTNPLFDKEKFLKSCGIDVYESGEIRKLSKIQEEWLKKKCPACKIGDLHEVDGESEQYLWCNECDVSMDSGGGYTK